MTTALKTKVVKTKVVKVEWRGETAKLVIHKLPHNKKMGDQSYRVLNAKGEPIGEIIKDDSGEIFAHRARAGTTPDEFQLNEFAFKRPTFESALSLAARWDVQFH